MVILVWLQALTFVGLSLLHLSWALGGTWGFEAALPTNEEGKRMLNPKKVDSLVVGIGLSLFAAVYLIKGGLLEMPLPYWISTTMGYLIPAIFLFRSIGDFRYIGFFKNVRGTTFAIRDTRFYSPLCLLLALNGIFIQIL